MAENLELDPLFDTSINARVRRFVKRMLEGRFLLIALLIHAVLLIIFGGKVIFEAYQKVNLEAESLMAPSAGPKSPPPPPATQPKMVDVKVEVPKNSTLASKLAIDKLSDVFNVAVPEIQNTVSVSMDSGMGMGGGGSTGGNGTSGFANVNFFGISAKASSIIFLPDISRSMNGGAAIGHSYDDVIKQVTKGIFALSVSNTFNIITFAKGDYAYQPQLVAASNAEKSKAATWYRHLSPEREQYRDNQWKNDVVDGIKDFHLGTRADMALEKALEQRPGIIMFVSDGEPTGTNPDQLISRVREWKAKYGANTIINTVFYATGSNTKDKTRDKRAKDFMKQLAAENGGEFRSID